MTDLHLSFVLHSVEGAFATVFVSPRFPYFRPSFINYLLVSSKEFRVENCFRKTSAQD